MIKATVLCALVLASPEFFNPIWIKARPEIREEVTTVCKEVAEKAIKSKLDPVMVVALAYSESRFSHKPTSKVGAVGPLQVVPRWTCPGGKRKGCDLVQAGLNTLIKHAHRYGCGKERKKHVEKMLHKGGGKFEVYAMDQPLCKNPDWETVLCHYNSGTKCHLRHFPRLVLRRAEKIRKLVEDRKR